MKTFCIACNSEDYGMISLYRHPKNLDKMFEFVSGINAFKNSFLCISCYDEVKSFHSFKTKCIELQHCRENSTNIELDTDEITIEEENVEQLKQEKVSEKSLEVLETSVLSQNEPDEGAAKDSESSTQNPCDVTLKDKTTSPFPLRISRRTTKATTPLSVSRSKRQRSLLDKKTLDPVIVHVKQVETDPDYETEEYIIQTVDSSSGEVISELVPVETDLEQDELTSDNQDGVEIEIDFIEIIDGNTKSYKCPLCDKVCKQKGQLKSHFRVHSKERPYSCPHCDKSFSENGNLKQHIRSIHLDLRPFVCDKCNKSFKTHYSHRVHVRSCVTLEKPYQCSQCEKSFISSGKLLLHKRRHTGERPYACSVCTFAFYDSCTLKRHIQRRHKNLADDTCTKKKLSEKANKSSSLKLS